MGMQKDLAAIKNDLSAVATILKKTPPDQEAAKKAFEAVNKKLETAVKSYDEKKKRVDASLRNFEKNLTEVMKGFKKAPFSSESVVEDVEIAVKGLVRAEQATKAAN